MEPRVTGKLARLLAGLVPGELSSSDVLRLESELEELVTELLELTDEKLASEASLPLLVLAL